MKHFRLGILVLSAALFSAAAWADGISDPKPIPQKGGGSTPITINDPNPVVTATALPNSNTNPCPFESPFCVDDVFQNQTGQTLTHITMVFLSSDNPNLIFNCPSNSEMLSAVFFDKCSQAPDPKGGEDITFLADGLNGFTGVDPASKQCVPDSIGDHILDKISKSWCLKLDPDDYQFVGGEFAISIYGDDVTNGLQVTTQAVTTPEPGAGLMVLFGALAFGLFKLVRRGA